MKLIFNEELFVQIEDQLELDAEETGLIIVDAVNGFCTPGMGNLAPASHDEAIASMVSNINLLARQFADKVRPILAFQDTHYDEYPEPPYPPHCLQGTGEELLVEALQWLQKYEHFLTIEKDCINGYIGSIVFDELNTNWMEKWMHKNNRNGNLVITGICSDICVLQLVQSLLSARNHGLIDVEEVIVDLSAVETYDLPIYVVRELGLPDSAAHPREIANQMAMYLMAQSGAILTKKVKI